MTEQIMFFAFGFIGATLIALLVLIAMRRRTARPVMQHPEAAAPVSAAQNEAGDNTRSSDLEQAAHNIESSPRCGKTQASPLCKKPNDTSPRET